MIIDGTKIAEEIKIALKEQITSNHYLPHLVVIVVGENPASKSYVSGKAKACQFVGIKSTILELPFETSEKELLEIIKKNNEDSFVHGILVQLPLPNHIDEKRVINAVSLKKDVDGFHYENIARMQVKDYGILPCTPKGIMHIFKYHKVNLTGKNVVVIGRSNIVGLPIAKLLLDSDATVTVCHSKTPNLVDYTKNADIIIIAVGKPKMLKSKMIKEGVIIIDVGINRIEKKIVGDCDFEDCLSMAKMITKVPGGVGPLTIACLLENTLNCYLNLIKEE